MTKLRITNHQGKQSTVDLSAGGRVRIGRSDQNEVVLTDPSLSRNHAEVFDEQGTWMLKDCGSRNGTLVGGQPIAAPVRLDPGMRVVVGACTLALDQPTGPPAPEPATVVFADRPLETTGTVVLSPDELIETPTSETRDEKGFNEELAKIRKRLEIVEKANLELLAHESMDVLLPKILEVVFEAVAPERAALVERQPDGELVCRAFRGNSQEEMTISRTIANTVIDQRVSVLTSDAQLDERFANGASIMAQGIQAVMAVPLWNKQKVIGLIYADSRLTSGIFGDEDLRLLTMLANIAALQIQNATLFSEQLEKQRFEREAEAAADIQQRLLPRTRPDIPGYVFDGHNKPCYECGGDYFDCLRMGTNRTGVVLSDVAGKGMGAAMLMAVIQATFQAGASSEPEPKELVDQLGNAINRSAPSNRYATLFFIDLNHETHALRYINAGHAPLPLLVRASGEVQELPASGPPLGLLPGIDYAVNELQLEPGDFIFASSDGVTDLENPDEEMFGEERLKEILVALAARPIVEIHGALDAKLNAFAKDTRPPDDLTYVILRRGD
jgi:sigma-B regulation protein RsbU (phosphoserine phosphatase)